MGFLKNLVKAGASVAGPATSAVAGPAAGLAVGTAAKIGTKAMTPKPTAPAIPSAKPTIQQLPMSASSLGEARKQDKSRMAKQYPGLGVA